MRPHIPPAHHHKRSRHLADQMTFVRQDFFVLYVQLVAACETNLPSFALLRSFHATLRRVPVRVGKITTTNNVEGAFFFFDPTPEQLASLCVELHPSSPTLFNNQKFLTALSVRPGKSFAISAHEFPNCLCATRKVACSSSVHPFLLMLGSNCVIIARLRTFTD